jgi:hypothetical protein
MHRTDTTDVSQHIKIHTIHNHGIMPSSPQTDTQVHRYIDTHMNSPLGSAVMEKLDRGEGCVHGVTVTAVRARSFAANSAIIASMSASPLPLASFFVRLVAALSCVCSYG